MSNGNGAAKLADLHKRSESSVKEYETITVYAKELSKAVAEWDFDRIIYSHSEIGGALDRLRVLAGVTTIAPQGTVGDGSEAVSP